MKDKFINEIFIRLKECKKERERYCQLPKELETLAYECIMDIEIGDSERIIKYINNKYSLYEDGIGVNVIKFKNYICGRVDDTEIKTYIGKIYDKMLVNFVEEIVEYKDKGVIINRTRESSKQAINNYLLFMNKNCKSFIGKYYSNRIELLPFIHSGRIIATYNDKTIEITDKIIKG